MSLENHPNLHCFGFQSDIIGALMKRLRGRGKELDADIVVDSLELIAELVNNVDEIADKIVAMYRQEAIK